jgi:hypothetical protein
VSSYVSLRGGRCGAFQSEKQESCYELAPALHHASRPVGACNTFEIEAQGPRLSVSLNDELVSGLMADDSRPLAGHIGLQAHHPGSRVQFQNIRMREF